MHPQLSTTACLSRRNVNQLIAPDGHAVWMLHSALRFAPLASLRVFSRNAGNWAGMGTHSAKTATGGICDQTLARTVT
jgi:hypothetical protein